MALFPGPREMGSSNHADSPEGQKYTRGSRNRPCLLRASCTAGLLALPSTQLGPKQVTKQSEESSVGAVAISIRDSKEDSHTTEMYFFTVLEHTDPNQSIGRLGPFKGFLAWLTHGCLLLVLLCTLASACTCGHLASS